MLNDSKLLEARTRFSFHADGELVPADLKFATEIWLRAICESPWATNSAMKVAAFLTHMLPDTDCSHDAKGTEIKMMENELNLTKDEIVISLNLMKTFGTLVEYNIEHGELFVTARLNVLLTLQLLETKQRLQELRGWVLPPETTVNDSRQAQNDDHIPSSEQAMFCKAISSYYGR